MFLSFLFLDPKIAQVRKVVQGEWKYSQKYMDCLSQVERSILNEQGYPQSEFGEIFIGQEIYRRCDNLIPEEERKIQTRKSIFDE